MTNPFESHLEAEFSLEQNPGPPIESTPFHLLVLSDLSGEGEKSALSDRIPIEIDRDNFDEVLGRISPRVQIDLEGSEPLILEFRELDDFHPDNIYRKVSLFNELRDLRSRLNNEDSFYSAAKQVRERWDDIADEPQQKSETANEPPAAADDDTGLLDSILERPSGGGDKSRASSTSDLGELVAQLVRPHLVRVDEEEREGYLLAVDRTTSALMRSILHFRPFQKLEAAWRGLYFLVRRVETSAELKIFAYDVSAPELADNLQTASSLADSELYRHMIRDTIEVPNGIPWAAAAANYDLEPSVDDIAFLMRVSKIAAVANASFITHMRPELLGVHSLSDSPDPRSWDLSDTSDAGKLWSALRRQSESQFLGITLPRYLAREPYGSRTDPIDSFAFEEFESVPDHDKYLWSNSCFPAAALLCISFSEAGWSMRTRMAQEIDGLPTHVFDVGTSKEIQPCTEVLLSEIAVGKLIEHGLMPLAGYKNSDRCRLAVFQSIAGTPLRGMWS